MGVEVLIIRGTCPPVGSVFVSPAATPEVGQPIGPWDQHADHSYADDAAEVLRAHGISSAHVAAFTGGSIIAQELALRHPGLVRSVPDITAPTLVLAGGMGMISRPELWNARVSSLWRSVGAET